MRDLEGDGFSDEAVVFTFSAGGDATYYYVAIRQTNAYTHGEPSNAIMVGDRITVEAVRFADGRLLVDTVDRKPGEPPTAPPSVQVTRAFQYFLSGGLKEAR